MKKMIMLLGVSALGCIANGNTNLIVNGGFEETGAATVVIQNPPVVDYSIPGWRVFNTDTNAMIVEVVSNATVATEGSHYLKVTTVASVAGKDAGVDTDSRVVLNDVLAGVDYTASFDLQHVSGTNSVILAIKTLTNGVQADVIKNVALTSATGVWTHYSYNFTPTQDGDFQIAFRPKVGAAMVDQVILLDNVSLVAEDIGDAVTNATFTAGGSAGFAGDLFQNATITASTPAHPVKNIADLFSKDSPVVAEDMIFPDQDGDPLAYVEFNTADAIILTNITIGLQADYFATESDLRAVTKVKVYGSSSAETVMDHLLARIVVNPEYKDTYGNTAIRMSIDGLPTNRVQYFRAEFTEDLSRLDRGARVFEIDGFGSMAPALPPEIATISDWSIVSDSVMRLVVDAPSLASNYYPKITTDLVIGSWESVPHSDDGVNAFVVTNLDYSTAEGTNEVIYVRATNSAAFFGIGGK